MIAKAFYFFKNKETLVDHVKISACLHPIKLQYFGIHLLYLTVNVVVGSSMIFLIKAAIWYAVLICITSPPPKKTNKYKQQQ